jgi:hypothetical protein
MLVTVAWSRSNSLSQSSGVGAIKTPNTYAREKELESPDSEPPNQRVLALLTFRPTNSSESVSCEKGRVGVG